MLVQKDYKFWFCTGSQDLYGDECLAHVAEHSQIIVKALNESGILPYEVVWKPTLITNEVIRRTFNEANTDENCAGVITWCHTFSPAKSWILGLKELRKPLLHLHTQFNREIPYDTIDMDFMNENPILFIPPEFLCVFAFHIDQQAEAHRAHNANEPVKGMEPRRKVGKGRADALAQAHQFVSKVRSGSQAVGRPQL